MVSKIDICNLALAQLGQEPITSLTQSDERARRLNLFYEPVKQEVLRTHNWAFAAAEEPLALLETREHPLPYVYQYPLDALYIRRVFRPGSGRQNGLFREVYIQAGNIRALKSNISNASAEYTRNVGDENLFDPAFIKAFSLALAADLAVALTGDAALSRQILQKYTLSLDEARRSNMSEEMAERVASSAFVEAR